MMSAGWSERCGWQRSGGAPDEIFRRGQVPLAVGERAEPVDARMSWTRRKILAGRFHAADRTRTASVAPPRLEPFLNDIALEGGKRTPLEGR
jgi:hypothetical protein